MYTPSLEILQNYARVLVDFALGSGEGIRPGDVVYLAYDSPAHPLAREVYRRILQNGAHVITKASYEEFDRIFYEEAREDQLTFFPKKYMKSLVDSIDHRMYLLAEDDPLYLKDIDPEKIMKRASSSLPLKKWLFEKEDAGKLTWTLALYGTEGMAQQAGISLADYWHQIVRACFLERPDPISQWKKTYDLMKGVKTSLNKLVPDIDRLHVEAQHTDLYIKLGEKRKFIDGGGCNIPSFELFTSPDWRGTEGKIYFDLPLYRYGSIVRDIHLEFKNGLIVKSSASQNENLIDQLIAQKNANRVGEYSLTDKRFSKITTFMANTLYDENFGGEFGNTHLAVGSSYHDTYTGDIKSMKEKDWDNLGFNESPEHTDMMATSDRVVTAILRSGIEKVIYKSGSFVL